MKDHSPIKRHQALVAFSRDHHFGLLLVWKIKQGLDKQVALDRISNYVLYFFEQDLRQHFEEEEQMLFPKLPADNPLRLRAEKDHALIYNLVERLQKEKQGEALLLQFSETLKDHIRFEERELFVSIQQTLTDAELDMVTAHDNKRSVQADGNWGDMFWEKDAGSNEKQGR